MPYHQLNELPKGVQNNLPKHAQEIYKQAFNNAWNHYHNPEKRKDNATLEETAHRIAWAAVEQKYTKDPNGKWVQK